MVFAAFLTLLALWMGFKPSPVPTLAACVFSPAIPVVIWSIAAHNKRPWAWHAAAGFFWVSVALFAAVFATVSFLYFRLWGLQAETLAVFSTCVLILLIAMLSVVNRGWSSLKEQRGQFMREEQVLRD